MKTIIKGNKEINGRWVKPIKLLLRGRSLMVVVEAVASENWLLRPTNPQLVAILRLRIGEQIGFMP